MDASKSPRRVTGGQLNGREATSSVQAHSLLTAASVYAKGGRRVLPLHWIREDGRCSCGEREGCKPGKHPRINGWNALASMAGADIWEWWQQWPAANIGVATGRESGIWTLDIDPDNGGDITLAALIAEHGPLPATRAHRTGSGGDHYVWSYPPDFDVPRTAGLLGKGIDTLGEDSYFVAPPSVSGKGAYTVTDDREPVPAPEWLLRMLREHSAQKAAQAAHLVNGEPVDLAAVPAKLAALLTEHKPEDRSEHFWRIVSEARGQYTQGQVVTLVAPWCKKSGKYVGRVEAQVAACWGKLEAKDAELRFPVGRHRSATAAEPIPAVTLTAAIEVFRRWLHLTDIAPLLATAAALVANKAEGDPVWLLLVGAPSTGKTELLSASAGLPWIHPAARVTEASLLSGTSAKERARSATGGLLRQVGNFGVLLCKDFTSVLAQNKDSSSEALAALREVYDGSWDRPVGTDGGKVLHWSGKCGLVGGVTPALDRYQSILSALGDRFLLLRLADADQQESGKMALTHRGNEKTMRAGLAAALCGLVDSADAARINDPLTVADEQRLIDLASFTARGRTAVMRDGYTRELLYLPQVEGPGRLVTAYARMLGALRAIGCDDPSAWGVLHRIAVSCMTAARAAFARELADPDRTEPVKTAALCLAVGMTAKHAREHLEDLALLGLAERGKTSDAANAHDTWEATEVLRNLWPEVVPINTPHPQAPVKEQPAEESLQDGTVGPSLFVGATCTFCGEPLDQVLIDLGYTDHGEEASQ